jgi:hypothetical protein
MIPGLAADIPYLCKIFARSVVMPLMSSNYLSMKEIKWTPEKAKGEVDEEEYLETEAIYRILAFFIHDQKRDAAWVSENCKEAFSETWLEAILDHKYLVGEIRRDLGVEEE